MNSTSFIVSQPCADTSCGPSAATPSFLPKTGDFPQVGTWSQSHPSIPTCSRRPVPRTGGLGRAPGWAQGRMEPRLVLGNSQCSPLLQAWPEGSRLTATPAWACQGGFRAARELG